MLEALSELEAVAVRLCTLRMDPQQRQAVDALCKETETAAAAGACAISLDACRPLRLTTA